MGSELEFGFLMHNRVTIDIECSLTMPPNTRKQKNKKLEFKFKFHFEPKLELNFLYCQAILGILGFKSSSKMYKTNKKKKKKKKTPSILHVQPNYYCHQNSLTMPTKTNKTKNKKPKLKFEFHFGLELELGFFLHPQTTISGKSSLMMFVANIYIRTQIRVPVWIQF